MKFKFKKILALSLLAFGGSVLADDAQVNFVCVDNKEYPVIEFEHDYLNWHWKDKLIIKGGQQNADLPVSLSKASNATFQQCEFDDCTNPSILLKYNKMFSSYTGYITFVDTKEQIYFSGDFDPDHPNACDELKKLQQTPAPEANQE